MIRADCVYVRHFANAKVVAEQIDAFESEWYLRIQKGSRELSGIGNRMPSAELVRVKFGVVLGSHSYCPASASGGLSSSRADCRELLPNGPEVLFSSFDMVYRALLRSAE